VFVYQILLLVFVVTPLCVWILDETLFLVFDILLLGVLILYEKLLLMWLLNWSQRRIRMIGVNMAITATIFSSLLSNLTATLVTLLIMITVKFFIWNHVFFVTKKQNLTQIFEKHFQLNYSVSVRDVFTLFCLMICIWQANLIPDPVLRGEPCRSWIKNVWCLSSLLNEIEEQLKLRNSCIF